MTSHLANSAICRIKFKLRCSMHGWHCYIFKTYPPNKLSKLRTTGPRWIAVTVCHICCGVACCIEESYSRLKTCRGRVSVTRLIKIALTLRHVYRLLDIHRSSPMRYWTHLRRASYVISDSTDSRMTCGGVAMVTLPQGEARCCFMGRQTDIIVLSNYERLVTMYEYLGQEWYWSHACIEKYARIKYC